MTSSPRTGVSRHRAGPRPFAAGGTRNRGTSWQVVPHVVRADHRLDVTKGSRSKSRRS